jgi:hypothetical protein
MLGLPSVGQHSTITDITVQVVKSEDRDKPVGSAFVLVEDTAGKTLAAGFTHADGTVLLTIDRNRGPINVRIDARSDNTARRFNLPLKDNLIVFPAPRLEASIPQRSRPQLTYVQNCYVDACGQCVCVWVPIAAPPCEALQTTWLRRADEKNYIGNVKRERARASTTHVARIHRCARPTTVVRRRTRRTWQPRFAVHPPSRKPIVNLPRHRYTFIASER